MQMEVVPGQQQEEMEDERQVEVVEGGQEEAVEVCQGNRRPREEEPGGALQGTVALPSTREEPGINQVAGGEALPKIKEAPGAIQEAGEEGERAAVVDGEVHRLHLVNKFSF